MYNRSRSYVNDNDSSDEDYATLHGLNDKRLNVRQKNNTPIYYVNDSDYSSSDDYVTIDDMISTFKNSNQPVEIGYSSSDSELMPLSQVSNTIKKNPCVILYSSWCGYSRNALELLKDKKKPTKKIEIEEIKGNMDEIRNYLSKENLGFPKSYSSRPMIFMNGKFIGGYDQLRKIL